jgi:hypothetical protein
MSISAEIRHGDLERLGPTVATAARGLSRVLGARPRRWCVDPSSMSRQTTSDGVVRDVEHEVDQSRGEDAAGFTIRPNGYGRWCTLDDLGS